MSKTKVAFLEGRFLSSQLENLKSIKKPWEAGPQKSHFCFDHVNRLLMPFLNLGPSSLPDVMAQPDVRHSNRTNSVLAWYD